MPDTTRLQLPLLAASQAQKHVTHNEALLRLDALVQLSALSATLMAEPALPADGDIYLLPPGKTGTNWGSAANHAVAHFVNGVWQFLTPQDGWFCWVRDDGKYYHFDSNTWSEFSSGGGSGASTDLDGVPLIIDTDGDSSIGADGDDAVELQLGGANQAMHWSLLGNTQPMQPSFLAARSGTDSNVTGSSLSYVNVVYGSEIFDRGDNYDPVTGVFTAPVSGIYSFIGFVSVDFSDTPSVNEFVLALSTSNRVWYSTILNPQAIANPSSQANFSAAFLTEMDAGDTAILQMRLTGGGTNNADIRGTGYFAGSLLA